MDYRKLIKSYIENEIETINKIDMDQINAALNLLEAGIKREAFIVTGITVREGNNNSLFVAMPSYKSSKTNEKGKPIYRDYCNPTTK